MKHNIADILLIVACVVTACTDNKEEPTTPTPTSTPVVEPAVEDKVPIGFSAFVEQTATTRDGEATPTPVYGAGTLINNEYTYYHGITGIGDLYNDTETGDKKGFGVFAVYK